MYTGIRISQTRLNDFMTNKIDLRQIYLNPEISEEYFDVSCQDNICYKTRLTDFVLPEDKLPSEGYKFSDDGCENILISIPSKDRPLLRYPAQPPPAPALPGKWIPYPSTALP